MQNAARRTTHRRRGHRQAAGVAGNDDAIGASRRRHEASSNNRFAPLQSEPAPDWSELPVELLPAVFEKLGAAEVLMGASLVCRAWLEAARVPHVWRRVEMRWLPWGAHLKHHRHSFARTKDPDVVRAMVRLAVDRSKGRMEVFAMDGGFVTDELLKYVAERSSCLKSLSLSSCGVSNQGFLELIARSPLLEEINIFQCRGITKGAYLVARG